MSWQRLRDPKLQHKLYQKSRIIQLIREFFIKQNFFEAETPILVKVPGQEPYLNPLKTELRDEKGRIFKAYLITSPEYAHKKFLAAGFRKTFEITKAFRSGEPWGETHNPEFTILEWYRANADYKKIMKDTERLIIFLYQKLFPNEELILNYQNLRIDLSRPWPRISLKKAWEKFTKTKFPKRFSRQNFAHLCFKKGYPVTKNDNLDDLFFKIFLTEVEPNLPKERPVFLYDYPVFLGALAKRKKKDPNFVERFELYIGGLEIANAFSELNDPEEQKKRFLAEQKLRKRLNKEVFPFDLDFLDALRFLPKAAGIALGVDRLAMLFTNSSSINEVIAFPAKELWSDSLRDF